MSAAFGGPKPPPSGEVAPPEAVTEGALRREAPFSLALRLDSSPNVGATRRAHAVRPYANGPSQIIPNS